MYYYSSFLLIFHHKIITVGWVVCGHSITILIMGKVITFHIQQTYRLKPFGSLRRE